MIYRLTQKLAFPHPQYADEDGLLAVGGDLSPERLLLAYQYGIFPWYSEGEPLLWWSPDPRWVLFPSEVYVSKTMRQVLQRQYFNITFNQCFERVIEQCSAAPRPGQDGTWIVPEMREAYTRLHNMGFACSVEAWQGEQLVGGLYGTLLGKVFYGESMFSLQPNASKAALITWCRHLTENNFLLIDCQMHTPHLESMGARPISRLDFLDYLKQNEANY